MFDFQGKHVLVTGATSGIGRAIAIAFSSARATVTAIGLPSAETRQEDIQTYSLDVTNTPAVEQFIDSLSDLHVVVNAAGVIFRDQEFEIDVFNQVLDVNLVGVMRVCMASHSKLKVSGGSNLPHSPGPLGQSGRSSRPCVILGFRTGLLRYGCCSHGRRRLLGLLRILVPFHADHASFITAPDRHGSDSRR